MTTLGIEAVRLGLPVGRRPKNITEDVRRQVCNSLRSGHTPREAAEMHGLSQVSVYRILRMDEALSDAYMDQRFRQRRDAYRLRFASQTWNRADYTWLYRNDREWLNEQKAKTATCGAQRRPNIDWPERDKLLAQQVAEISNSMLNASEKPRWISRSTLEREIGMGDTIERNADKLPTTHLALSTHSESHEEYQRRRLDWAANELKKSFYGPPPRWQLLRRAGIRVLAKNNEKLLGNLTFY